MSERKKLLFQKDVTKIIKTMLYENEFWNQQYLASKKKKGETIET